MELVSQGAEALVFRDQDVIVKDRFEKKYRLPVLDRALRSSRAKREAKVLDKLAALQFPAPKVLHVDGSRLTISFIPGPRLRDVFHTNPKDFSREIGRKVGLLHSQGIIHGDLTTSNMIVNGELFVIDFGLSFFSDKPEDRAVDLFVLDRALESKHWDVYEDCIEEVFAGYRETCLGVDAVMTRFDVVRSRGRNKKK